MLVYQRVISTKSHETSARGLVLRLVGPVQGSLLRGFLLSYSMFEKVLVRARMAMMGRDIGGNLYLLGGELPTNRKWVITPVINGICRVNPLITGVITHLLSGMNHQVDIYSRWLFYGDNQ